MDPLTISALISGGLQLGKGLFGAFQSGKAKNELQDLRANRPTYETPESAKQALGISKQMAYGEMPGKDYTEQRLGRATAAGARRVQQAAPSSTAALGALTDIYGRQLDAERDLGYQAALYRQNAMQNYQNQLGQMANYEDQAFNINQWMPYQTRMNELQSQRMAGQQNMWGGLQGAMNVGMNYMGTQAQMNAMNQMYPGGGASSAIPDVYGPSGTGQAQPLASPTFGTPSLRQSRNYIDWGQINERANG